MSINIRILNKPEIPVMTVSCDGKLNNELEKYEMTQHLNKHTANFVCGRMGSGKSSLLWGFFKSKLLKKTFDKILYFCPIQSQGSVKDNIFSKLPQNQQFVEMSLENLQDALSQIKGMDKEENSCLIIDDMTAYLKNPEILKLFKEIIFNKRHLHVSIFFLVQSYYSIPKDLRRVFDNAFIYRTSRDELQNIFNELIETHKDMVLPISKVVYDKPFNYLMVNFPSQKMYKKFDEIIIGE